MNKGMDDTHITTENMFPPLITPSGDMKSKIVSVEEAVRIIRDGDTIGLTGFVGSVFAEEVILKIEEEFLKTGHPRDLSIIYSA
ncbi:MAG: hypothetical protein RRA35_06205, partial [Desulfomonilia bacterium]|nr:hypothetical protein [Desulfomonilia bacterium]